MYELFETTWIGSLELKNRSVRSATWSGVGDERGYVTDRAVSFYKELGAGGIGLIVTGYQHVLPNGRQIQYAIGNYEDEQIEGLGRLAAAVHDAGGRIIPPWNTVNDILAKEKADYVAMCRPFIREPHLMNRWKSGDTARAACISCSGCFETGKQGLGISCKVERMLKEKEKRE